MVTTTYPYMMSETYCASWTPVMAVRELVANALDASSPEGITFDWADGMGYIFNKGVLLLKEHLLLGESQKDSTQIGQFGEGLKIAALALCRDHRMVWAASGNFRYHFSVEYNSDFDRNMLNVAISDGEYVDGTKVAFACCQRDFEDARSLFLSLQPYPPTKVKSNTNDFILMDEEHQGHVYVLGVKVTTLNHAIFGYDLADKCLINRDRTVVDHNILRDVIRKAVAYCNNPDFVKKLLSGSLANPQCYEAELVSYATWSSWEPMIKELFGEKVCIASKNDHEANARAAYLGYAVLTFGAGMDDTIVYSTKLRRAHDVKPPLITGSVPREKVGKGLQAKVDKAVAKVFQMVGYQLPEVRLSHEVEGFGFRQGGIIFLNYDEANSKGLPDLVAILIHEAAHLESGYEDCTARFEAQLTQYFARIVMPKRRVKASE